jgi:Na+/phosphate symporter
MLFKVEVYRIILIYINNYKSNIYNYLIKVKNQSLSTNKPLFNITSVRNL